MGQTAETHCRLAASFDNAAGDETAPPSQRMEFVRKANWLRIRARLAAKGCEPREGAEQEMNAVLECLSADAPLSSFKLNLLLRHYDHSKR